MEILIIGKVGEGKTTVAEIISETLMKLGMKVTIEDDPLNDPISRSFEDFRKERLEEIKGRSVTVVTRHLSKDLRYTHKPFLSTDCNWKNRKLHPINL